MHGYNLHWIVGLDVQVSGSTTKDILTILCARVYGKRCFMFVFICTCILCITFRVNYEGHHYWDVLFSVRVIMVCIYIYTCPGQLHRTFSLTCAVLFPHVLKYMCYIFVVSSLNFYLIWSCSCLFSKVSLHLFSVKISWVIIPCIHMLSYIMILNCKKKRIQLMNKWRASVM